MTSAPAAATRLARLMRELAIDIDAFDARAIEMQGLLATWDHEVSPSRATIIVAAVNIHGWYTALEAALERTARLLDETVPAGPAWHAELVSQMSGAVPGLRPAVVEASLDLELAEIRKFRHFFRNAYVIEFDPRRIREQSDRIVRIHQPVRAGLERLKIHVTQVLDALAKE